VGSSSRKFNGQKNGNEIRGRMEKKEAMEIFGDGRQNSEMASGSVSGTFAEDFDGRGRGDTR